jgi:hypothetical protein
MELSTYDPYDLWMTPFGFRVKHFYNHHRILGLPFAALCTLFDVYINDGRRFLGTRREYPIVRALASQALLNLYLKTGNSSFLSHINRHLAWLHKHTCTGYHGPCWGLGFRYAVGKNLVYDANTPLTTMTPYALEAFVRVTEVTNDPEWIPTIQGIFQFLERDVVILEETDEILVTSYATMRDRRVINAISYVMYSYAILLPYLDANQQKMAGLKIRKLYNYIANSQMADGSWYYSPDPPSFIDCFHSCIILKNLIKTSDRTNLLNCQEVIDCGYAFLKKYMYVGGAGLFKRFAKTNKPGLVRFDLYDNAEMLQLAQLMGDEQTAATLEANIMDMFVHKGRVFSQIDWLGVRLGPDRLRWAVLPLLYALSLR